MKFKEFQSKLLENKEFEIEFCKPHTWDIVSLRKKAGLTQRQLAKLAGMKQPAISRIESYGTSDFQTIGKVAHALGYRVELKFTPLKDYKLEQMEGEK